MPTSGPSQPLPCLSERTFHQHLCGSNSGRVRHCRKNLKRQEEEEKPETSKGRPGRGARLEATN